MQARELEQSLLLAHSGRQLGGMPMNSGKQEQDGMSPFTMHCEFGPQGEGWHGSPFSGGNASTKNVNEGDVSYGQYFVKTNPKNHFIYL